ncbi:hypothetical protein BsWGS_07764 [Bradybaena similaris]
MTTEGPKVTVDGKQDEVSKLVEHTGGCHCGAVRFKIRAPEDLVADDCNCSICTKKQIKAFDVPKSHFVLLQGEDNITTYTFNTGQAKHTFCKTCGVESFYTPRSNPDAYSIMYYCLDPGTVKSVRLETFDGVNWEQSVIAHSQKENPVSMVT